LPDRYVEGTCPNCGFGRARGDQCDNCGRPLDPQQLIEPRSTLSGQPPEFRETEHFFLDLRRLNAPLLEWAKQQVHWRPNVYNFTLRFLEEPADVLILGPVGVGKTMLASCLGYIACRRRHSVHFSRADQLLKRLKAARLDATYEQELRRLLRVDLLILDDYALEALDATETHDFYQVVVERHRRASTILTSNREPQEWLALMADPMLAQSAVDRIVNSAYELVLEGESYRSRQKPGRGAR